jgi:hypothetical protein
MIYLIKGFSPAVVRDSRNTGVYYSERNYSKEEILKLISFYRLPRAYV